jgi:hypothetical protein
MARPREPIDERFWRFVSPEPNSGCWLWMGKADRYGYGVITTGQQGRSTSATFKAHRLSWTLHHGDPGGQHVLHTCDQPACCNPAHLFLGTQAVNMADKAAKGRARGERCGYSRLTEADVREIRRRCAAGETQEAVARAFSVTRSNVSHVARRVSWSHVGDSP